MDWERKASICFSLYCAMVVSIDSLNITATKPIMYAPLEETFSLKCGVIDIVEGVSPDWFIEDTKDIAIWRQNLALNGPYKDRINVMRSGDTFSLVIEDALLSDNMTFICIVSDSRGVYRDTIHVVVIDPIPSLTINPSLPVSEGTYTSVTCALTQMFPQNSPLKLINGTRGIMGGERKTEQSTTNVATYNIAHTFDITPTRYDNRITALQCQTTRDDKNYNSSSTLLHVSWLAESIEMTIRPNDTQLEGSEVEYQCETSSANPATVITWYIDGDEIKGASNTNTNAEYNGYNSTSTLKLTLEGKFYEKSITCSIPETDLTDSAPVLVELVHVTKQPWFLAVCVIAGVILLILVIVLIVLLVRKKKKPKDQCPSPTGLIYYRQTRELKWHPGPGTGNDVTYCVCYRDTATVKWKVMAEHVPKDFMVVPRSVQVTSGTQFQVVADEEGRGRSDHVQVDALPKGIGEGSVNEAYASVDFGGGKPVGQISPVKRQDKTQNNNDNKPDEPAYAVVDVDRDRKVLPPIGGGGGDGYEELGQLSPRKRDAPKTSGKPKKAVLPPLERNYALVTANAGQGKAKKAVIPPSDYQVVDFQNSHVTQVDEGDSD